MRSLICCLISLYSAATLAETRAPVLLWNALSEYKLAEKSAPRKLAALDGQVVRIPGYMIPLEVKNDQTSEFLLLPSLANCIHVPPPPANQTVHVKMSAGTSATVSWKPIWVEGRFKISKDSPEASFELGAPKVATFSPSEATTLLPTAPTQGFDCQGRDKNEAVCAPRSPATN